MRQVFLVRHGSHDRLGRILCGRMPGVALSETGRAEAQALARRLAGSRAGLVLASPRERTAETAAPIAASLGLAVATEPGLDEIAFGAWTGRAIDDLAAEPAWTRWNTARATARPPGGESMAEAQARVMGWIGEAAAGPDGATVAAVTHADVIKAAVCGVIGLTLDNLARFDIAPASVTRIVAGDWGARVIAVNEGAA